MPLDPHAKKLLDMLNAAGAADMSRVAPRDMRENFERFVQMVGMNGVAVDAADDREVPGPGGPILRRPGRAARTSGRRRRCMAAAGQCEWRR